MQFGLLGPVEVLDDAGAPIDLGGRQPRTIVAMLLAAGGRPVTPEAIIDAIWGDEPPATATGTVQSYVSRLRRRLGGVLQRDDAGYRFDLGGHLVEHVRFEELADHGRALLDQDRPEPARAALLEADARWRGPALVEFADHDFATGLATRLEERRLAAIEDRLDADLRLCRHDTVTGALSELVTAHPLRERLQAQLALALYRAGRQADALRALAEAGRTLRDEVGIGPTPRLRELEAAILAHDPALEPAVPVPSPAPAPAPRHEPAAAPIETTRAGAGPALVGRESELRELTSALAESGADARFVVVEGEPGIGKTRLVDELRRLAAGQGAIAVWGRADEGGAAPALWPWLGPLRALAGRDEPSRTETPALADLLGGGLRPEPAGAPGPVPAGDARHAQHERFEAVAGLVNRVAARQPVVVLLDDLQWADATSLELLEFLTTRAGPGLLVVGTVRQLEVGRHDAVTDALATIARRPGARRLLLRGLTADSTAELLDAAASRPVPPTVVAAIHARAEGNPFYAVELARLLDEEEDHSGEIPGTVSDVIRRRLAHLPPVTTEILGVAAVVGRDIELDLLAGAAGRALADTLAALEPAAAHRLLVEIPERPAELRFSHALVREVLLDDLTSLRRAQLHLAVAEAMERRGAGADDAEILAEHLWRAAPVGVGQRAAAALERAAAVALRRVSYATAEGLLTRAVQLRRATAGSRGARSAPDALDPELAAIVRLLEVARARRYFQGAAPRELIERAKELAERGGHRDLLLDLLWFEWSAMATSSRLDEAEPLADAYTRLTAEDDRPEVRASGHQVRGVLSWCRGRIDEAAEHLDTVHALLDGVPEPCDGFGAERRLVGRTFWLFNHAVRADLPPEVAFAEFDELIGRQPDRFGVASVCGFAATTAIALGRWPDVERFAGIGLDTDPDSQFAFWGGQVLMQRAIVAAWQGDTDAALATFAGGRARYTGIGGHSGLPSFEASLGMNLVAHGRLAEATTHVRAARAALEARQELWNEPIVLIAEGIVAHAGGERSPAAACLARAVAVASEQGSVAIARRAEAAAAELGLTAG